MQSLLAVIQIVLGFTLVSMVLVQGHNRTVPILSARNFFYFGLSIFQITSAAIAFWFEDYWETPVGDPAKIGSIYTSALITFLIIFEVVYRTGWFSFGLPRKLMTRFRVPTDAAMLTLSTVLIGFALLCKFVLIYIPVFGVLSALMATALAAAAAGIFCWTAPKRLFNPAVITVGVFVLGAAFVVGTYQAFGRRDILSVMTGCLWGAYHGHYKYLPLRRSLIPLASVAGVGVLVLAAFTAARSHDNTKLSQGEMNTRMAQADLKAGLIDLLSGQYAAGNSMWLIQSRPESFPYDTLHSLRYATTQIIPRDWYPGKPVALGLTMVPEAGMNVNRGDSFTLGPGLMGHVFNDNPWVALPLYPIILGVILHIFDRLLRYQPSNPFIVIPIGGALGECIALARGEFGLYLFRLVLSTITVYLAMVIIGRLVMSRNWREQADELPPDDQVAEETLAYGEVA
jgi:hypothetical protein